MADNEDTDGIKKTLEQILKEMEDNKADLTSNNNTPLFWRLLVGFSKSGAFFLVVGLLLLGVAILVQSTSHSSMTFVFVVLGAAITMYGTGTQAAAKYKNSDPKGIHPEILIAGGAGVMSLLIAFGFIKFSTNIKSAFREDLRLAYFDFEPENWSPDQYVARLIFDGKEAPLMVMPDGKLRGVVTIEKTEGAVRYRLFAKRIKEINENVGLGLEPQSNFENVILSEEDFAPDARLRLPEISGEHKIRLEPSSEIVLINAESSKNTNAIEPLPKDLAGAVSTNANNDAFSKISNKKIGGFE